MAVESKDDLAKLTIAQLKEKLKQRRLAISGTKSELVSRLHESLQEEENLLIGESGAVNDDLDVDDLLGTGTDHTVPFKDEEDLLLGPVPKGAGDIKANAPTKSVDAKASAAAKETRASKTTAANGDNKTAPAKPTVTAEPSSDAAKAKSSSQGSSNEGEDAPKSTRPRISVGDLTGYDAKKKREERFGAAKSEEKPKDDKLPPKSPSKTPISDEAKRPISLQFSEKLMERAKRFGLPVGGAADGAPLPKTPKVAVAAGAVPATAESATAEDDPKVAARKQRFGAS